MRLTRETLISRINRAKQLNRELRDIVEMCQHRYRVDILTACNSNDAYLNGELFHIRRQLPTAAEMKSLARYINEIIVGLESDINRVNADCGYNSFGMNRKALRSNYNTARQMATEFDDLLIMCMPNLDANGISDALDMANEVRTMIRVIERHLRRGVMSDEDLGGFIGLAIKHIERHINTLNNMCGYN